MGEILARRLGIDVAMPETNAVIFGDRVYFKSDAAIAVLSSLPRWSWVRACCAGAAAVARRRLRYRRAQSLSLVRPERDLPGADPRDRRPLSARPGLADDEKRPGRRRDRRVRAAAGSGAGPHDGVRCGDRRPRPRPRRGLRRRARLATRAGRFASTPPPRPPRCCERPAPLSSSTPPDRSRAPITGWRGRRSRPECIMSISPMRAISSPGSARSTPRPARPACVALTGASSTPALSHAVLDRLTAGLAAYRHGRDRDLAGQPRRRRAGLSVMRAILSYAGKPVRVFAGGGWTDAARLGADGPARDAGPRPALAVAVRDPRSRPRAARFAPRPRRRYSAPGSSCRRAASRARRREPVGAARNWCGR